MRRCVVMAGSVDAVRRVAVVWLVLLTAAMMQMPQRVSGQGLVHTDSLTPYRHLIPLYDDEGNIIDPKDTAAPPYSPAVTCGKCHAVDTINHGWHFNSVQGHVPAGRPGEPWIYYDPQTRTQAPMSYRDWKGLLKPEALGISRWDFTRMFGRALPGAGPGLPPNAQGSANGEGKAGESEEETDLSALPGRWHITGPLENDCMICHAASRGYDVNEWAKQIENENFKWAPTAALGVATVKGDTKSVPQDFDPLLSDPLLGGGGDFPIVEYDVSRFDKGKRIFLDIVRQPPAERCYYCHTVRNVAPVSGPDWQHDQDVHLRAGMTCADCHRHGIDHQMVRGYPGEAEVTGHAAAKALSCRGCHLGEQDSWNPRLFGGRLGAPRPAHRGIPPLHFDVLTCTACHSGPWPEDTAQRIQTAMAHGLGLSSEHRGPEDPPYLLEPIYFRNGDGVIEPRRMVWPAYWGRMRDGKMTPLKVDILEKIVKPILKVSQQQQYELPGGWKPLTTQEIEQVLKALQPTLAQGMQAVYVAGGKVHLLDASGEGGKLTTRPHAAAGPYSWPLAHDVRGAGESLGVRGCADCHALDSPMVAGVFAAGPASPTGQVKTPMLKTEQYDALLAKAWALAFIGRTLLKVIGFVCCGIILLVVLRHLPVALPSDR